MEENIQIRCRKVLKNLKRNRFEGYYAPTKTEARELVRDLIQRSGGVIACGESATLKECGIMRDIRSMPGYINTDVADASVRENLYRESFFADVYLSGVNAVIEDGRLFLVDGRSNRTAAIAFGPKSVIVVAGYNKICASAAEAAERVRRIAAPKNCQRLSKQTYCAKTGVCTQVTSDIGLGCASPDRICCSTLISSYSRIPGRIKVILIGETAGF